MWTLLTLNKRQANIIHRMNKSLLFNIYIPLVSKHPMFFVVLLISVRKIYMKVVAEGMNAQNVDT